MTVVVGIRGKNGVLLAGDSQASTAYTNRKYKDAKTYQLSDVVALAYCGSGRLGQILTFHLDTLEDPPLGMDESYWAVRLFVPHLRDVCEAHGHLHIRHNVEHLGESAFLLAVRDRLFTVDADLCVAEETLAYSALGSGEDVAVGSLYAALGDVRDPIRAADDRIEEIAFDAVAAATEFTNFVGGDVTTVKTVAYTDDERALARRILKK